MEPRKLRFIALLEYLKPCHFGNERQHIAFGVNLQNAIDGLCAVIVDSQGGVQSIAPQAAILVETYFEADRLPAHLWSWVRADKAVRKRSPEH
jgi:hypothetical protein